MTRTRFERLFDHHDALAALWLASYWRLTHRADDAILHRAARVLIDGGQLTAARWQAIRDEARHFEACTLPHTCLLRAELVSEIDLALAAGLPLDESQWTHLRRLLDVEQLRPARSSDQVLELTYLQGMLSRAAANALAAAKATA